MEKALTETGLMPLAAAHCPDQLQSDSQASRWVSADMGQDKSLPGPQDTCSQLTQSSVAACLSPVHGLGYFLPG